MNSVGFTSCPAREVEKMRKAWHSLNALLKNITNAEACVQIHNLKIAADHLKVAKWNVSQVKKAIAAAGQGKRES